ncbi:Fumarylacetoacetate hydrolase family protein [Mycetocola reblochoni REB411]|uniref:Fumarylacetoacetate hydrolase family protein n=1 Tax=Mycetocola reblochoni REB411 TaxID=1255698 RepID=A0A1R4K8R0_9MICO|nr:Fumarylacetoacetate hydrolase family protein [Mycetocola reblochoni REB411]
MIVRFAHIAGSDNDVPVLALVVDGRAHPLDSLVDDAPSQLGELIDRGEAELARIAAAPVDADSPSAVPLDRARLASAVLRPPQVIAVGLNYTAHSSELNLATDAAPTLFSLWPNSLSGHDATTSWPASLTSQVDYEAELGVIIGTAAKDVTEAEALDHVFGYTVVNDITARDIQYSEAQWSRCKSFDGFTPTGPVVVTADEIPDPQALRIRTVLDGDVMQDAGTDLMVRGVATLVARLSRSTTLLPGTLISTGSPGGAGYSRDPQVFLTDGATVTVSIDAIGELTTHCRVLGDASDEDAPGTTHA